jgi:hypothetical protein
MFVPFKKPTSLPCGIFDGPRSRFSSQGFA